MKLSADQLLAQRVLSVPEAAQLLRVNPPRVRAMIEAGILDAAKVGGRWLVSAHSVEQRRAANVKPGRQLSPRRARGLLLLASGTRPDWLSASEVSKLRRRLKETTLGELAPRLRSRAVVHRLRAHPSDLARIGAEANVVLAGMSAASEHRLNLSPATDELDAYVPARLVPRLKQRYLLQPSPRPNVTLRAMDGVWPFAEGTVCAPAVVVGLDLLESDDARLQRAGKELLGRHP